MRVAVTRQVARATGKKNCNSAAPRAVNKPNDMKLKLITLTAMTALALGGTAFAQDQNSNTGTRHGGHGWHHDPMAKLTESLNLTADQKAKIQPIVDEAKPKMQEIHRDAMQKSKAVMDDTMAKIRPLLNADQQKKLDEMKSERANHRGHHRNDGATDDENS
jgi:Spy/CpxP family protein refolding chaperone